MKKILLFIFFIGRCSCSGTGCYYVKDLCEPLVREHRGLF